MAGEAPLVAVASNMSQAMTEISDRFEEFSGTEVKLSFGSSGNITRQILQGAPYQIFLSASQTYVNVLRENGHSSITSDAYATGRIGIFISKNSHLAKRPDLDSVINAVKFNEFRRLVVPNPEFAPYGIAARQALERAGIWVISSKKLLIGENAAQAMQFSISDGVDAGVVPASYAVLPKIKKQGRFFLIPEYWHKPIQQYLVLLTDKNESANRFYSYLLSDEPKTILKKYGYTPAQ